MATYLLYESAVGYSLFRRREQEEIGATLAQVQESVAQRKRFKKLIKLIAFYPFETAEQALENIKSVRSNEVHDDCAKFISANMPSVSKKKYKLAVEDPFLPNQLGNVFPKLKCVRTDITDELFRGIRMHFAELVKGFTTRDLGKAQLGLGHAYSRSLVQHDIKRQDKHIMTSISLLDQLDKDINLFAMRLKEWFSWNFPELNRIVGDNITFTKAVSIIHSKEKITNEIESELTEIVGSEELAQSIIEARKSSAGQEFSTLDESQMNVFTEQIVKLVGFRENLVKYLKKRMVAVAPNLTELIGELVGARLIAQAGGLSSLARCAASTIQILGAEKALFRALKSHGNTPKYGILYHSSFIGKASQENKGKISRFLANKCALAARIDFYFPFQTAKFGARMREQVEERLLYFKTGERGPPNEDIMHEVLEELKQEFPEAFLAPEATAENGKSSKSKKSKDKTSKSSKKSKKAAKESSDSDVPKKRKRKSSDSKKTKKRRKTSEQ